MNNVCRTNAPLFPKGYRASGVLLDVAALPSPYGIGDVGPTALAWIDQLQEAGQSWWHALQTRRSGSDDSVSPSYSSLAGNVLLISPDWLIEDGLLEPRDCECVNFTACSIDYDVVVPFKHWLIEKAWNNFNAGARKDLVHAYTQFRTRQSYWLEDYALFGALKAKYRGADFREWPAELARRTPDAIADARHELSSQIDRLRFSQFILSRQTHRLKEYAHTKGVRLIGDLPFCISADSSDAWAHPELFACDEQYASGAPANLVPFCFSSRERLVPDHDRAALSRVSYRWCVDRLRALLAHVDVARLDVRTLDAPWHAADGVPATRRNKHCCSTVLSGLIGDGLAMDRSDGFAFRDGFNVPETRILQFAFDGRSENPHLPQNYSPNSVVYTAAHDVARTREWFNELPDHQRAALCDCLERRSIEDTEVAWEFIRMAWSSAASLAIVAFPDLLNLGQDTAGQNGHAKGHYEWRCNEEMLSAPAFYWLRELTNRSGRLVEVSSLKPKALRSSRAGTRIEAAL